MPGQTRILIISDQPQRLFSQITFAIALTKYGYNIAFVFAEEYDMNYQIKLKENKIHVFHFKDKKETKNHVESEYRNNYIKRKVKKNSVIQVVLLFLYLLKFNRFLQYAKGIIDEYKPHVIILNGDRSGVSLEQAFLKQAKRRGIKTLMPYNSVISNGITFRLNNSYEEFKIVSLFDKLIFWKFPFLKKSTDDNEIVFYDSVTALTLKLVGTLSSNPWFVGNGLLDKVCINNKNTLIKNSNEINFPDKFEIVGDLVYDFLYDTLNRKSKIEAEIRNRYKLKTGKKIILIALPQFYEHKILDQESHRNEINYILESVTSSKENVLVSLHPKMQMKNYKFLEKDFGCKVLKEPLQEVLAIADLFVSINSSTIDWAILLGIKVVMMDYFNLDSSYFFDFRSISFVSEKAKLQSVIRKSLSSKTDFSDDWELLDREKVLQGNIMENYHKLIQQIVISRKQ